MIAPAGGRRDRVLVAAGVLVGALVLVVVGVLLATRGGDGDDDASPGSTTQPADDSGPSSSQPEATTTTTVVPTGELGGTEGRGREIAPGVVAERFTADPSAGARGAPIDPGGGQPTEQPIDPGGGQPTEQPTDPNTGQPSDPDDQAPTDPGTVDPPAPGDQDTTGRIRVAGPGGITLVGSYRAASPDDWVITVDGAEGALAGVAAGDAHGLISSAGGVVAADVTVALPDQPEVVPAWEQAAAVRITHQGGSGDGALVGNVEVSTSRGDAAIALRGPVAEDGSYLLAASGHVEVAGSTVPLAGSYTGRGSSGADHRWSIGGLGGPGSVDDVAVRAISIAMTEAEPGVTGTAELAFVGTTPLRIRTDLRLEDAANWSMAARGASTPTWSPEGLPALDAATAEVAGEVTSTGGRIRWGLRSPMRLVDEDLTMTGTLALQGSERATARVHGASGSVLGVASDVEFGLVDGTLHLDAGQVSGSVELIAIGELLLDLPDGWQSRVRLQVDFATEAGGPTTTNHATYSMDHGASQLRLVGTFDSSASFALDVTGSLAFAGTSVPFDGWYRSTGYESDGVVLTEPAWAMSGDLAGAPGGSVDLGGGAAIVSGALGLRSPGVPLPEPVARAAAFATPADDGETSTSFSGEVEVQLSEGDPFTLAAEVDYVDEDDWVLTVATVQAEPWSPPGMTNLTIGIDDFSGTVTSEAGELTWAVEIDEVRWDDATSGVTITTGFSLGTGCPLEEHCPEAEGIFVGFHDGEITFPDGVPDMALAGAFLTDGSWARFEAEPDDVELHDIEISDAGFTMWKGPRSDSFDPSLEMPDLASLNNDFGLEFCGQFRVDVPDVDTLETGGCASWAPEGVVMAQVGTGGDIDSGESNGVSIGNVTLEGFGWTDLGIDPVVVISGVELPLEQDRNHLTGVMHIPADLMKATGNPEADATIGATGWFEGSDFSLDGAIDVSMRSGGFTLDSVSVHIGKDGERFTLGLGADATVSMSGNHFPVSAFVGVEAGSGSGEIVVRLSAQGAVSADPNGGFDLPSLLLAGDFEPDYTSMVEGDFDAKPASSVITNGDFEDAVPSENVVTNGSFEDGTGEGLFPEGDFEGAESANVLPNGDFEDTDILPNGDFETGDAMGWAWSSGYSVAELHGVTAPTEDEGAIAMRVTNTQPSGSVSATPVGFFKDLRWDTVAGATYDFSVWVRSSDGASRSVAVFVDQKGTAAGCSTQAPATTGQTFTVDGTWRQLTLPVAGVGCRDRFTVVVNPTQGGARIDIDSLRFEMTSSPVVVDVPGTQRPWMQSGNGSNFDAMPPISGFSDVYLTSDHGNPGRSMRSDGNGSYWQFNPGSYGDVEGDFELSYDVYFPASGDRDIFNMGFWLTGSGPSPTGYEFRVQSGNSDSGFHAVNGGKHSRLSGDANYTGTLARGVWHRVSLTGSGSYVTGTITRLDTGEQFYRGTMSMPAGNRSGVFGQVADGRKASVGHRVDNLHVTSAPGSGQSVRYDPGGARTGDQYLAMGSPTSGWHQQVPSGEAPEAGQVYTYSAWLRASAPVSGNLIIETEGGPREMAYTTFSAGPGSWTRHSVTLPIAHGDHGGLRVGFTGVSPAGVELHVDDMSLQEIPWIVTPTTPGGLSALVLEEGGSEVHSGQGSLLLSDRSGGTTTISRDLAAPQAGATYTASVWLASPASSQVALRLTATGGSEESQVVTIPADGTWRQHRVALPVSGAGHDALRLEIEVRSPSGSVYVDDIEVTAEGAEIPQVTDTVWGSSGSGTGFDEMPPISRSSDVSIVTDHGNPGTSLRTDGSGSWWQFGSDSYGRAEGDFDLSYDVYFPSSGSREIYNMGFWLTGSGASPSGYAFRVQSAYDDSGFFAVNGGGLSRVSSSANYTGTLGRGVWHRVRLTAVGSNVTGTITRLDTGAQVYGGTVALPAGNRAGVFGQVADALSSAPGLRVDNVFVHAGSPAAAKVQVREEPGAAHDGAGHLRITNQPGQHGGASRSLAVSPSVGSTYVATAWVRAPGGTVEGSLGVLADAEESRTPFTATGDWQQVRVDLPVSAASAGFDVAVDADTPGGVLDVDDVTLTLVGQTQVNPWQGVAGEGGTISTAVWSDEAQAHTGEGYLEVRATGAPGRVVSAAEVRGQAEAQHTASAWVRSATGEPVSGALVLGADGGAGARGTAFTAGPEWQQVYVTLPGTEGAGSLQAEVEVGTLGAGLLVDDVRVRPVPAWSPTGPEGVEVDEAVVVGGEATAASGPGFLRVRSTGPGGGVTAHSPATVRPGGTYTLHAYVRAPGGAALDGRLVLAGTGTGDEAATLPFTATDQWQHLELSLDAALANTALRPTIELAQGGELDVDQITLTQDVIVQEDPWQVDVASGGSVEATVQEDVEQAHDSSGLMVLTTTGPAGSGISHGIEHAPVDGATYAGSAWVRSPSGSPVTGRFQVSALGGSRADAVADFTADATWRQVSVRLPIETSAHSSMRASLVVDTPGVELHLDDVDVQQEIWTTYAPSGGEVSRTQVNDGARAESGSGYLAISKATSTEGGVQLETPGNVASGSSQTVSAYVRSSDGGDVAGHLRLAAAGGGADDVASTGFTAGPEWKKVTLTLPVAHDGQSALRTQVLVDEVGAGLDVDSVTIGQEPLGEPDGVTTPLPHPERGYAYLWDDAFGIKGAHLWALTAQITFTNGSPGLGVGGTLYFDPAQMPGVMVGTEWLKADMTVNVSRAEPCMAFGFDGTGTDTRLEIDGGVFSTSKFTLGFAPRGCEVGDYVVPPGSTLAFDTELGDSTIHLDLQIGRDDDNLPTFYTDLAVHDLVLAGTTYDTMSLLVDISSESSYVGFVGDFTLPMGDFYGDFELSVNADLLHMEGQVSVSDWKLAGGSFDVDEFGYYQVLDVPFGAGACASFAAGTDGRMSMGGKRYVFDGDIELDCGVLKALNIHFDYMKGGQAYRFDLDYDGRERTLEGGVGFEFKRKVKWKHWGFRYKRHPKFGVDIDYAMDIDKPSSAALRIRGEVSVSGGSGSLDCSLNSGGDDGCSIYVRINKFGGATYRSNW